MLSRDCTVKVDQSNNMVKDRKTKKKAEAGVLHCSLCSLKNGNCSFFFKEHLLGQMFFILGN